MASIHSRVVACIDQVKLSPSVQIATRMLSFLSASPKIRLRALRSFRLHHDRLVALLDGLSGPSQRRQKLLPLAVTFFQTSKANCQPKPS